MLIHPLAFGMPDLPELLIIALIGLLFFGKRLPEVGRSIGKTIVEFKKGMHDVETEMHSSTVPPPASAPSTISPPPQLMAPSGPQAYKFDPYTGKAVTSEVSEVNEK